VLLSVNVEPSLVTVVLYLSTSHTVSIYIVSQKNETDVAHYNFNAHQPILVIFSRDIAERICFLFSFFIFSDFSETNCLRIRWTDFRNLLTE